MENTTPTGRQCKGLKDDVAGGIDMCNLLHIIEDLSLLSPPMINGTGFKRAKHINSSRKKRHLLTNDCLYSL